MRHEEVRKEVPGGAGAVLFIHGFLGSPLHFEEFVKVVPENFAVYNLLLEGHGKGTREFGEASMAAWKAQAESAASKLAERYKNVYIVAHSMGTFFAMDASLKYPGSIKGLFLMGVPLKIGVKPDAAINTFKSFFNLFSKTDPVALAYRNSHNVKLDIRLWLYLKWIPRYLELFKESKAARETIKNVKVPCRIYQSKNDELVSMKSMKLIPSKSNICPQVLEASAHFIYSAEDMAHMIHEFQAIFDGE